MVTDTFSEQLKAQINKEMRRTSLTKCTTRGINRGGIESYAATMTLLPFIGVIGMVTMFIVMLTTHDAALVSDIVWATFGAALTYGYGVAFFFLKPRVVLSWTLKALLVLGAIAGVIFMFTLL